MSHTLKRGDVLSGRVYYKINLYWADDFVKVAGVEHYKA